MSANEKEDLAAARAGNRQAFDSLCLTHRQEIVGLCFRFVHDRDDAQDITQETFARAWRSSGVVSRGRRVSDMAVGNCPQSVPEPSPGAKQPAASGARSRWKPCPLRNVNKRGTFRTPRPLPEQMLLRTPQNHDGTAERDCARAPPQKNGTRRIGNCSFCVSNKTCRMRNLRGGRAGTRRYWRNRWRDKIKPVLEQVCAKKCVILPIEVTRGEGGAVSDKDRDAWFRAARFSRARPAFPELRAEGQRIMQAVGNG